MMCNCDRGKSPEPSTFLNFARTGYPDDALRDMVQQRPQMNVHFCVYTHLFRFTHHHIEFLQEVNVLHELAKAAIWVSEILRSLSLYTTCLPIFMLPLLLSGYPYRTMLNHIAPGIFIFDMIHLFPELFPFCTQHPKICKNFCLNYNLPLTRENRLLKLIEGMLTLTPVSRAQLETLYEYIRKLDKRAYSSFTEFLSEAKFVMESDQNDWFYLNRSRLKGYVDGSQPSLTLSDSDSRSTRQMTSVSSLSKETIKTSCRTSSGENLLYQSLLTGSGDFADDLLEQPEMIVKIARDLFKLHSTSTVKLSTLMVQINEAYVNKSGQCAANMDILSSLMESPQFSFNYDNSEISFVPCL
ncbi:uncharacterized protein LOC111262791 isoform X2 [Varroa jacobsoni]|uniref:uncharacterized protein LOC111262791 isoform X2 n=1 Tax=Varroa jacobsoni TaxID=62625 RepID=UPI000BF59D95|nr:uncharacterized protein LOC111262791 isoform X2 [Varroa jacobsoni]